MTAHVLILGGTAEARRLAQELAGRPGLRVTSSLAGRVAEPRMPPGEIRVGGFGGVAGLAGWLRAHEVAVLVDATHPFAETMSAHAAEAAARTGTELLALSRPGWEAGPGDRWHWAASLAEAAALLPALGTRIFLTTGRLGLAAFADLGRLRFLIRSVEAPEPPLPRHTRVLLDRGPYTVAGERELLRTHAIDVLVTKDSGGQATAAKLTAARELGVPVVVVRRPARPAGVTVVTGVAEVLDRIRRISRAAADTCP
ncbi:cobalt-precorrin-6A reductase [Streptomyces sp. NPDC051219]|uniref:cobalt-precorrin-6A reductase n=1 Tax=Streptomyces sp. NPDC051219 TaxID=3155283 RepID=UPI003440D083